MASFTSFAMTFETTNQAFIFRKEETSAILELVAKKIEWGEDSGPVFDTNGNKIGEWGFEKNE